MLFERLSLKSAKKTAKTRAASTAEDVLEELALVHELPRKILEYRSVQKLKSTYVDALPGLVNPETGRIHATFNQTVAATGRLSVDRPEPAEHPDPHAPRAGASARPSSPSRATCCSRPTTARSSCACSRTSRATRR